MSFNNLSYDQGAYKHQLRQSVGPYDYLINTPTIECHKCFPLNSNLRFAKTNKSGKNIDVDSELIGITRKTSNSPEDHYLPSGKKKKISKSKIPDCSDFTGENSRLTNPPLTLKGTGWNRWQWLNKNPQDKSLIPFETNQNMRLIAKDNHRPILPDPIDQTKAMPKGDKGIISYNKDSQCVDEKEDCKNCTWSKV